MIPKANTTLRAVERSIRLKPTYARRPPVARWTMSSTMSTLRMPRHTLSPSTSPTRPTRMSTTPKICANRLSTISDEPPRVLHRCLVTKYTSWAAWWMRVFLVLIRPSAWKADCAELGQTLRALLSSEVYEGSVEGHHGSVERESSGKELQSSDERNRGVAPEQRSLRRVFREGGSAAAPCHGSGCGRMHGRTPRRAQDPWPGGG